MIYSFIIPHKNVPTLLERCLTSIPERDDTEIIIVDDSSDPNVVDFEHFPGLKRKNTQCIFLKESRGAGHARNVGIDKASGRWLLFADADDFYTENISLLLDLYKEDTSTNIVYLNAQSYFEKDGSTIPQSFSKYFERFANHKFYSEKVLRYNIWTPWSRMVQRELVEINNIRYEEIPVGNDKMFCLKCSKYANSISIESRVIYNYFIPEKGSVTHAFSTSVDTIKQRLELQYRVNQLYSEVGFIFKQSYIYGYLRGNVKDNRLKLIYKDFMSRHSISYINDLYHMLLSVGGKLFNII